VGYYPGAKPIALKILFDKQTGHLLGAQAAGEEGVDKRIDVLAVALRACMTVDDLAGLELCYAPPYGAAKDPVNLAGMAAQNIRAGLVDVVHWNQVGTDALAGAFILDVRDPGETKAGMLPGATNIPLGELRRRLDELPRQRDIVVHCQSGQRSYNACRLLSQHGFAVRNLSGSWRTWKTAQKQGRL
jgi:rhodanese-related sulfurtransferase